MKQRIALITMGHLGMLVHPVSAVVLANGGFETGDLSGWGGNFLATTVGAPAIAGAQEGAFAAKLEGPTAVAEVNQFFPANPGDVVTMSGYMLTEAAIPAGPSFGLFKIVFKNVANGDIPFDAGLVTIGGYNASFPGAESTPFVNNATPINTWVFSEVQVTAPAETASVQLLALNVDFAGGNNPIWFDGIQASIVPEPTSLMLSGLGALTLLSRRRRQSI
jgi:hypothetical protein